jgi:small-conductance mechanosensitive channel
VRSGVKLSARTAILSAAGLIVGLIAVGILGYYSLLIYRAFPLSYGLLIRIALTLLLGVAAIVVVQRLLLAVVSRYVSVRRAGLILASYRILAYTLLAVAALVVAGINSLAILAAGGFAGLVLGLAGQVALSNVIAGITLLAVRPIHPGERVTLVTWQYSLLMPVYPPKFFSQDVILPGYTGTVVDLGLVYSYLHLDDGPTMKIPNSILIQAAIISHELTDRWVRIKYEVPNNVEPLGLIDRLEKTLPENPWVVRPELLRVQVNQATQTSYVISVDAMCRGSLEEPPRSSILIELMKAVKELKPKAERAKASS